LGKTGLRCQWQIKQGGFGAAVEKIEEQRKPDDFFGYRKPAAKPKMPQVRILSSGPNKILRRYVLYLLGIFVLPVLKKYVIITIIIMVASF